MGLCVDMMPLFPSTFKINISLAEPLGLRIDINSRLLYWTDAELGTISVSKLDGGYRNTLVETEIDKPGAIVTEPYRGYIYFTDWGIKPKIERSDGDGTNRLLLVNTLIIEPRSLAIDLKERALYWIDSAQKSLERVNYDGTGRTLLKFVVELNIFSLGLDDDAFFWSGYSSVNGSAGNLYFLDRKLETDRYSVRWQKNNNYKGISLRPYQESDDVIPDTCPTASCRGLCLPKPYGSYSCWKDDETPPVFQNCPDTISVSTTPGKTYSLVSWGEILLKDNNDFIVSSSHKSGSEFFLGSEVVSIAAKDLAGNEAWCNFSVTVNGYTEKAPLSPTVYLVICIGGALVVLVLIAVTLQLVFMSKLGRQHERHSRNQGVDNASVNHTHSGDVLVSAGSVQYTIPEDDSYYTHILDDY
ncbi:Low-density lipoprotein receptor-related protein 6 [Holothuria leucospilota]|uniref:Low-density lipoprotein receptor-related protein 6 n=1 Tax=Holothuria leucospilota TaxID=206669 RepID=A0A9Q1C5A4_HOLLE|nr:Low-density lipoprotein receptor-related protein 6 [Holothuria leucospilota]